MTIRRPNRNATTDPKRAMFTSGRVPDDNNGFFKFRFKIHSCFFIPYNEAPGRTVTCLFNSNIPGLTIV